MDKITFNDIFDFSNTREIERATYAMARFGNAVAEASKSIAEVKAKQKRKTLAGAVLLVSTILTAAYLSVKK